MLTKFGLNFSTLKYMYLQVLQSITIRSVELMTAAGTCGMAACCSSRRTATRLRTAVDPRRRRIRHGPPHHHSTVHVSLSVGPRAI